MAIVQVSRITHRKGLSENLPQLAGAELGWVIDDRKLYIGNGTIDEGAPAIGNTEILTEYSNLLDIASTYTYTGEEAGYTVQTGETSSAAVTRSLQNKLDDFASVRDFGAVGDGVVDDTDAINRALYQLFCRETNTEIRRSLFFPAGTYRITDSINIPPYAKLIGDGNESSIIKLDVKNDSTVADYVVRTADNAQNTGVNIGNNGAVTPTNINVSDMSFHSDEVTDILLIEDTSTISFDDVTFKGPLLQSDVTDQGDQTSCVRFGSTGSLTTNQVTFDRCVFTGCTFAFRTDDGLQGLTVSNSKLVTLNTGGQFGTRTHLNGGPDGVRFVHNLFDKIAYEGLVFGGRDPGEDVSKCISAYNIFLDVGNEFQGLGSPSTSIVDFRSDYNVSIGDMFERDDTDDKVFPRIELNNKKVFSVDNGERIKFGSYKREAGQSKDVSVNLSETQLFTIDTDVATAFRMRYKFVETSGGAIRFGTLTVVAQDSDDSSGSLSYTDDYSENAATGFVLSVDQTGSSTIAIKYTATAAGTFNYSFDHLG